MRYMDDVEPVKAQKKKVPLWKWVISLFLLLGILYGCSVAFNTLSYLLWQLDVLSTP